MSGYDTDIAAWSERQAQLLRLHAAQTRANDPAIDWPNIIAEIESVGRSERSALASHVRTILEHLAKLEASPATEPRAGWRQTVPRAGRSAGGPGGKPQPAPGFAGRGAAGNAAHPPPDGRRAGRVSQSIAREAGADQIHPRPGSRSLAPRKPSLIGPDDAPISLLSACGSTRLMSSASNRAILPP
jgi:Domain of unknown function DUF29